METLVLGILFIAAVTSAEVAVQCSEQFIAQHGSVFPVSGSCEKYLECYGGQLIEQACQDGFHFSVDLLQCVPEIEARCSSAQRQIMNNGTCNNSDEVSFHADPHHCARYVLCLGNTTIPRLCASGLLFNAETGQCDFPLNVFCDVTCPSGGNDLVFIGDSSGRDCARYSICLNGVPRTARCSSMLYFDLVSGTCRQPEVASCRIRHVHCSDQDELIADSENCSGYYQCEGGLPHYRECEEGQIFSGGRCVPGYCGDIEVTTEVEASTVSTTAVVTGYSTPQTTSESATASTPTVVDFDTSTTTVPTTSDATSTVVTVTSPIVTTDVVTSTQPVTPSTVTTPATTSVIIPEVTGTTATQPGSSSTMTSVVTTESNTSIGSSATETTSATSAITSESTTPIRPESPSTPSTESSSLTSQTTTETTGSTQGSSTVTTPSTATAESSTTTSAVTADSSTPAQTGSPPSTATTPTEPPPSSTDPTVVCHGSGIALIPHPYRCDQYFVCIFGSGSLATCDQGLLFDVKSMVCVPSERVACVATQLSPLG